MACGFVLYACGSDEPPPPPKTAGVMPWGADLQGFGDRKEVRCDGDDQAVRMVWLEDQRFVICRPPEQGTNERYLRAWTVSGPDDETTKLYRARFFNLTDNSLQFLEGDDPAEGGKGVKFDVGRDTVTIEWPKQGRKTVLTSVRTGEGWTRLD